MLFFFAPFRRVSVGFCLFGFSVGGAQRILNSKAVADNFPFIALGRHHECLLELLAGIIWYAKHAGYHDQQCFLIGRRVDHGLWVECGDCMLCAGQILEKFLDMLLSRGAIPIPNGDRIIQIEPGHLLFMRGERSFRLVAENRAVFCSAKWQATIMPRYKGTYMPLFIDAFVVQLGEVLSSSACLFNFRS